MVALILTAKLTIMAILGQRPRELSWFTCYRSF
jgi:hypothetical protein